jgi:hypothetical protein
MVEVAKTEEEGMPEEVNRNWTVIVFGVVIVTLESAMEMV